MRSGNKKASSRRRGVESSATRTRLIEAAGRLIRESGYAAVTSRTLADRLGLSRQIVHYYFKSIDDLLVSLVRQRGARSLARLEEAAASAEPLRAVWKICSDPDEAALSLELNALANRRPAVRAEVKRFAEEFRRLQTHALVRHLEQRGIEPAMKPMVATVLLTSLSQILALEKEIGIELGHEETLGFVDACLRAFAAGWRAPLQPPSSSNRRPLAAPRGKGDARRAAASRR